jgi:CRP-like cAMP-binding protein
MEAADFMQAMERPAVNQMVLAYKEALGLQFAYAALSHGTATIDARLARWILMLHDRVDGDTLAVVHNTIADLLAVRRSGVTTALHVLEGMGAIKSVRAQIIVKNRAILEQVAASTFGLAEAEYESLISRMPPPDLVN